MLTRIFFVLCAVVLVMSWAGPFAAASPARQDDLIQLVYGQTVDGQINTEQPSMFYVFEGAANDVITITMVVTGGDLDPFLVLNNADRVPLTTDDNSGGNANARLAFVIPTAGRYIIQATHAGGIPPEGGGTYTLNLTAALDSGVPTTEPTQVVTPIPTQPTSDIPTTQGDSTRLARLEPGSTVRDTLDRQAALRLYWFEAEDGDQVAVTPEQLADFQPLVVLYNAAFAEQARGAPGAGIRTILPEGGIYFLAASLPDTGSAGGGYGFIFDQTINPATAESFIDMAYGESQRGNIDSNVPAVSYRFFGSVGDAVTITMSRAGGDLNSYLYLLDGAGQLLFEDNDSAGTNNGDARITYTLPVEGPYLIVATRLGQAQGTTSGSYLLELDSEAEPPAITEESAPVLPPDYAPFPILAYGETVEGELSSAKFMDIYVFLGNRDDPITVELTSLNSDEANGLDPLLVLLDDQRIPLTENDDIVDGVERDSRLEFTLPRNGYYAIVATRFDQDAGVTAGPYELTLSGPGGSDETEVGVGVPEEGAEEGPIALLSPTPLEAGVPAQTTFSAGAALYSFEADSGTLVDVAVTTDLGLDSVLILADENLTEVLSSGTGALTGITIPKSGKYVVFLAPRFGPADVTGGGYILALTRTSGEDIPAAAEGPQVIAYGDTVNGVIDDIQMSQTYTFTGIAGERVRITMEATPGASLDCYLELQDAAGEIIEANDDIDPGVIRDSQIEIELPADGTYTILASRYVGPDSEPTTGTFRLNLERLDGDGGTGVSSQIIPLVYGQTEAGEITDEQYLVFYVFEGTAGQVVSIEIDNLSGNLDSVLHLYQSVGEQWVEIASNDDSPTGGTYEALLQSIVLPQTGKYLIAVNRYGLDREGTFGTFAITLTLES
jgi:hypothetical protein